MAWVKDTNYNSGTGGLEIWRNTYTASGSTFTAASITGLHGRFERLIWSPGSPTPDSSCTITITTDEGLNILAVDSAGSALNLSAVGTTTPRDANGNEILFPFSGGLAVGIADNSTSGAIVTLIACIVPA